VNFGKRADKHGGAVKSKLKGARGRVAVIKMSKAASLTANFSGAEYIKASNAGTDRRQKSFYSVPGPSKGNGLERNCS